MDVYEVYALNIQPSQLKEVTPVDAQKLAGWMDIERLSFLGWLRDCNRWYDNQLDAWADYKLYLDNDEPEEEADLQVNWFEEAMEYFYQHSNSLEMLGNYSFENAKLGPNKRLPAQM